MTYHSHRLTKQRKIFAVFTNKSYRSLCAPRRVSLGSKWGCVRKGQIRCHHTTNQTLFVARLEEGRTQASERTSTPRNSKLSCRFMTSGYFFIWVVDLPPASHSSRLNQRYVLPPHHSMGHLRDRQHREDVYERSTCRSEHSRNWHH